MTPLLARDPTSDACFFHALVMCDGVGFRLRTMKAMACGSVVQSAHVPIYEQPLSRSDSRQFPGACNASMLALLRVGVCHKRCILLLFLCGFVSGPFATLTSGTSEKV